MNCKLCHGFRVKSYYKLGELIVGQCKDCHFKFVINDIKEDALQDMYSSQDAVNYFLVRENRHLKKFNKRLSEIMWLYKNEVEGLTLLDIGCGGGEFCYLASQNNIRTTGIDISKSAIQLSQQRWGKFAEFINIELEDYIKISKRKFDIITLWDVIEHCKDPHKIISGCLSLVKKGGYICIDTPNGESLYDRISHIVYLINREAGAKLLKQRYSIAHLQIWTQNTLSRLLKHYGIEVVIMKKIRELTSVPSMYVETMDINMAWLMPFIRKMDFLIETLWPIRNKLLIYAQVPKR